MTISGGRTAWSVVRSTGSTPTTRSLASNGGIHSQRDAELAIRAVFTSDGYAPLGVGANSGLSTHGAPFKGVLSTRWNHTLNCTPVGAVLRIGLRDDDEVWITKPQLLPPCTDRWATTDDWFGAREALRNTRDRATPGYSSSGRTPAARALLLRCGRER